MKQGASEGGRWDEDNETVNARMLVAFTVKSDYREIVRNVHGDA